MEDIKNEEGLDVASETVVAEALPEETAPVVADEPVADATAPPGETAEPKPSEAFRNRIKSAYPEDDFSDDEAFFGKASEQLDNLEQYRNNNMEANKALMEIFNAEPTVAEVLKDMIEGASFREAISRHFSADELTPVEGDPDREGWKRNSETRTKRLADNELANKTKQENDEFSAKEIADFAKENDLDPDRAQEFLNKVGEALDEVYSGKISKGFLSSMWKALNHENDVKNAAETARIAGRNEKIVAKKEEKPKGDGLPALGNANNGDQPQKKPSWIDNLANSEKKKQIL